MQHIEKIGEIVVAEPDKTGIDYIEQHLARVEARFVNGMQQIVVKPPVGGGDQNEKRFEHTIHLRRLRRIEHILLHVVRVDRIAELGIDFLALEGIHGAQAPTGQITAEAVVVAVRRRSADQYETLVLTHGEGD